MLRKIWNQYYKVISCAILCAMLVVFVAFAMGADSFWQNAQGSEYVDETDDTEHAGNSEEAGNIQEA